MSGTAAGPRARRIGSTRIALLYMVLYQNRLMAGLYFFFFLVLYRNSARDLRERRVEQEMALRDTDQSLLGRWPRHTSKCVHGNFDVFRISQRRLSIRVAITSRLVVRFFLMVMIRNERERSAMRNNRFWFVVAASIDVGAYTHYVCCKVNRILDPACHLIRRVSERHSVPSWYPF